MAMRIISSRNMSDDMTTWHRETACDGIRERVEG
jgi:hypothetical protein